MLNRKALYDMEFIEWVKLIAEVGALVMCAGLIGYGVYTGINILRKWFEHKISKENEAKPHAETIETRLKITPEVKSVLKELLLQTHACRAFVFEFHNGTTSLGGLPFIYMSCTYEVLSQTASSQLHARQRMPFTLFDSIVTQLVQRDVISVDCRDKSELYDPIIYNTMKKRNTSLLICSKLFDEHKRVIGFVGIDYCDQPGRVLFRDDEGAIKEMEKIVLREAQALSTLLYVKIAKE